MPVGSVSIRPVPVRFVAVGSILVRPAVAVGGGSVDRAQPLCDRLAPDLAGGCARQIGLRPDDPTAHALKLSQARVGLLHHRRRLLSIAAKRKHRARFGAGRGFHGHHRAGSHAALLLDGGLEILRVQVQARGGHNDFALAAEKAQLAGRLALSKVAGGQPFVGARLERAAGPGSAGDGGSANEHFAIWTELDFASGEGLADGALGHVKRVVQRD